MMYFVNTNGRKNLSEVVDTLLTNLNWDERFEGLSYPELNLNFDKNTNTLILEAIYIDPELQGKGIGTIILKALEEAAQQKGIEAIELKAFPWTDGEGATGLEIKKLVSWYAKRGYEIDNMIEFDALDDEEIYDHESGIDMVKVL